MGFMNYIETFFFFSLAVSFVLILLLVYHFKQRMTTLEQKSDTMVSIINDIAKELTYVRQISTNYMMTSVSTGSGSHAYSFPPPFHQSNGHGCSDRVENASDDADDDADDDEDYSSDEDEDDDEEDGPSTKYFPGAKHLENIDIEGLQPSVHIIVVSDTEVEPEDIKVVCLEHSTKDDFQETCGIDEEQKFTNITEDIDIDCTIVQDDEIIPTLDQEVDSPINEIPSLPSLRSDTDLEMYRKMSTQALKATVLASGLSEDPSKMKKPELLQLLGV